MDSYKIQPYPLHSTTHTHTHPLTRLLLLWGRLCLSAEDDGSAKASVELTLRAKKAGHEEVKQRPQLKDIVLRGSGRSRNGHSQICSENSYYNYMKFHKGVRYWHGVTAEAAVGTWMGVPDRISRWLALSSLTALVICWEMRVSQPLLGCGFKRWNLKVEYMKQLICQHDDNHNSQLSVPTI